MENNINELNAIIKELNISREGAVKKLFDLLYDPLVYFAHQYVKSFELAEEIVSDSFLKLWEHRESFVYFHQIRSFLYVCTKNASLNMLRGNKLHKYVRDIEDIDKELYVDPDLLDKIIKTELLSLMYSKLEELPDKQRKVFHLSFIEDLSAEEISERLDISLTAVYANKSRAITLLKQKLSLDCVLLICLFEFTKTQF